MYKIRITAMSLALLFFALLLSSCSKNDDPVSSTTTTEASSDVILKYADNSSVTNSDIDVCSETQPILLKQDLSCPKFLAVEITIKDLKLTNEQKAQIKIFNKEHQDCVNSAVDSLRNSEKAIIKSANEARKVILQNLKDTLITKKVAEKQLAELNKATKKLLAANPVKDWAKTQIASCLTTYFENISGILTADQLIIWNKWLDKMGNKLGKG